MTENEVAKNAYVSRYSTAWADAPPNVQQLWLAAWHDAAHRPPVLPDTTEQILRDEASGYDPKGLCYVRAGLLTEAADLICALATDSGRFQTSCDELRQRIVVLVKFVESLEFEQDDELPDDVWSIVQHWPGLVPLPNALGEGRERGILREASSGEAATSTDGLGVAVARAPTFANGQPCQHPGCLSHISHPCEGCGRIGGGLVKGGDDETRHPSTT